MRFWKCYWKPAAICPSSSETNVTDQNVNLRSVCVFRVVETTGLLSVTKSANSLDPLSLCGALSKREAWNLKTETTGPAKTTGGWNASRTSKGARF